MKRVRRNESMGNSSKERHDKIYPSLPVDLIIEILTKLPPGAVSKLICVSKLWSSIIQGKHFNDLYLTRSSTRPLLLGLLHLQLHSTRLYQYSSFQENPSSGHSIIRKTVPGFPIAAPVRGLICCTDDNAEVLIVANPSTSQFLTLPGVNHWTSSFFGYDPVNDLYKVFHMSLGFDIHGCLISQGHQVFTLGAQKTWRMLECKYPHYPLTQGICKNGVVYYGAEFFSSYKECFVLVCFELRLEEFSLITLPEGVRIEQDHRSDNLVSYNGKIALVSQSRNGKFDLWVLMDVIKQEWTKISVLVPCWKDLVGSEIFRCRGTISTGELIFEPFYYSRKFSVVYYNPKEDKARRVEFKGNGDCCALKGIFLDHVDSPMFLPRKFIN
ncbi:unnamed protein product [Microthlaspi erraticum]|uniref:F-box domain-containing protein n=1 Tax=Microthlaspi erraticum TaxID=1685480 RepID=A0A6D2JZT7_9BRAS|nr:unnamed protein product [Microthlaspi erraticum]